MAILKVTTLAFPGATNEIIARGKEILKSSIHAAEIEFMEQNPDAIFIITGGSEKKATELLKNSTSILILATTENNSYAAASEIKAYCNQTGINSILYNLDNEKEINKKVEQYIICKRALNQLSKYNIGLLGEVSEWLINSTIENEILNKKFGINLEKIAWKDFPEYSNYDINEEFINHFQHHEYDLKDSSKVYNLITDIIKNKKLDAITVECFPLVRKHAVTACLALSKLNADGIASGCEGDISSITGKILVKELTGSIPWMANLASIEDDKVFFAHCTIATNLVSDYKIDTHFETNLGTAVQGRFLSENVTVLRLNKDLTKAFLSYGRVVERPERKDSCRTQIKVEIPVSDIQKLKNNPLGNHHLIIPGNHLEILNYFFRLIGIGLV